MTARLFAAIELSLGVKTEIAGLMALIGKHRLPVRWTSAEQLHLTLKFYGNIEEAAIPALQESLEGIGAVSEPFSCHFTELGVFPGSGRPRVLWVGVDEGAEALSQLAGKLEAGCREFGAFPDERPFHPHLTIGWFGENASRQAVDEMLEALPFKSVFSERVVRLSLFRSHLNSDGSVYELLSQAALMG